MCPAKLTVYTKMVTCHKVHPCVAAGTQEKQSRYVSRDQYQASLMKISDTFTKKCNALNECQAVNRP